MDGKQKSVAAITQEYPYIIASTGRPNASAYLGFPYRYFLDEQAIYCE